MSRIRQNAEFEIQVDGETYLWRLHRQPGWTSGTERHGMAIAVQHAEGKREVMLEFPPGPQPRYGAPLLKPQRIPQVLLVKAIGSALAAGWDPHSRGKTVTIVVDETGA